MRAALAPLRCQVAASLPQVVNQQADATVRAYGARGFHSQHRFETAKCGSALRLPLELASMLILAIGDYRFDGFEFVRSFRDFSSQ